MPTFSERYGYKPVREVIQREGMDEDLRIGLWNILDLFFWEKRRGHGRKSFPKDIAPRLWAGFFKNPLDTLPYQWNEIVRALREYFFSCAWYEVFDFLEVMATLGDDAKADKGFMTACNRVLKQEMSAYRFIEGRIVEVTAEEEIAAIEDALRTTQATPAQVHLREALAKLSSRDQPDYRNSIKESISAVESVAASISGNAKASLGDALKVLESHHDLHPALKGAFSKLYGYTSDAQGIRHALMNAPTLDQSDARYMLVTCSAFVSYLLAKSAT